MIGRYSKIFLPAIVAALSFVAFSIGASSAYADDNNGDNGYGTGSIRVCKVIADEGGNVIDGSSVPGVTFSISGFTPSPVTSQGVPVGQIGTANFTTPLSFNRDVLSSVDGQDAQCVKFSGLALGGYYYGQESINPPSGWASPKYNDQFTTPVVSLADFFDYDGKLFDADGTNDEARNKNADGHIVLTSGRPNRTLVVLNQLTSLPVGGPSVGGNVTTPQCPTDRPQQVDQVWFSDIKPGEVTVHWANKGDAAGFHIAYGPSQNNLIWGVETNDGKASQFTLQNLPGGDLWVAVTAKSSAECGGPTSPVVKVGAVGPQVLGATGIAQNAMAASAGLGLIAFGLWQAQSALAKREKRA